MFSYSRSITCQNLRYNIFWLLVQITRKRGLPFQTWARWCCRSLAFSAHIIFAILVVLPWCKLPWELSLLLFLSTVGCSSSLFMIPKLLVSRCSNSYYGTSNKFAKVDGYEPLILEFLVLKSSFLFFFLTFF